MPPVVVPRKPQIIDWHVGTPAAGTRVVEVPSVVPASVRERGWQSLQGTALAVVLAGLIDTILVRLLPFDGSASATTAAVTMAADSSLSLAALTIGLAIFMSATIARGHKRTARLAMIASALALVAVATVATQAGGAYTAALAHTGDDAAGLLRTLARSLGLLLVQLLLLGWMTLRGWRASRRR